ncbi:hypothetical protein [Mesorhizobium sp. WSM2561]|uniref:hypothetical protein n=1 Tax=Mesorhizobium sp. WSM2561 TaxID=1040985 RepID=UPI0004829658|nr:hypothetical protein [Mesorhizobium sp. WSM2561]
MVCYFKPEDIEKLHAGREDMHRQFAELRDRFLGRKYQTERGHEFAYHGFSRRLGTMVRAVDVVFEKLPPELDEIPERDTVVDETLTIQAFVMNVFGCLDNLAWIWVCEEAVLNAEGKELESLRAGLGPKSKEVRASFSKEFLAYLDKRQGWIDKHLKGFRDSLAHRIPLYIPPFIVTPETVDKYNELEKASGDAIQKRDFELYDKLQAEQRVLGIWRPWMTHSVRRSLPAPCFTPSFCRTMWRSTSLPVEMLAEMERQKI